MLGKACLLTLILALAAGCSAPADTHVFTLYGNVPADPAFRIHVATFDASPKEGNGADDAWIKLFAEDNWLNCEKIAKLLNEEWDLSVKGLKGHEQKKFWCEKGRYRR